MYLSKIKARVSRHTTIGFTVAARIRESGKRAGDRQAHPFSYWLALKILQYDKMHLEAY